jgi:ribosome-binding ATPase YchF (GTP1/OBG family)
MKLSIAIAGLPNVGKSTLFNLLTKQNVLAANYPFATIDPNVGVVPVPDERLDKLATLSKSKKKVPAIVEFYDIAGLVRGANAGEGLGNQFLAHIRETQAIVIVLRAFKDDAVIHVENSVDPLRDLQIINTELVLKDLDTVEKRLAKAEGEARTGDKKAVKIFETLKAVRNELVQDKLALPFRDEEIVRELQLLTAKKQLCVINGAPEDVTTELTEAIKKLHGDYVFIDLAKSTDLSPLIKKAYEILGLISFLTTGEDETRAWTIERGAKAPQAAGVIHTDFEKSFIRAEAIGWEKLVEAGSWAIAKQKGWLRLEGRDYVVQDGDVMVIRHG